MKKKFLVVLMLLCISFTATSCRTADKKAQGAETTESLHAEESRVLELDSNAEGALGPNSQV